MNVIRNKHVTLSVYYILFYYRDITITYLCLLGSL